MIRKIQIVNKIYFCNSSSTYLLSISSFKRFINSSNFNATFHTYHFQFQLFP